MRVQLKEENKRLSALVETLQRQLQELSMNRLVFHSLSNPHRCAENRLQGQPAACFCRPCLQRRVFFPCCHGSHWRERASEVQRCCSGVMCCCANCTDCSLKSFISLGTRNASSCLSSSCTNAAPLHPTAHPPLVPVECRAILATHLRQRPSQRTSWSS
jgi:hypothetical protein